MGNKKVLQELIIIFWIFMIGSIIGYLVEMAVALVQKGCFESRQGLLYGPFTPVYGAGAVLYYLALKNAKTKDVLKIFALTALLGGVTEYFCSFAQEKIFGTISWDYSNLLFNINGRTSLLHCFYWGMGGVLYLKFLSPLLDKISERLVHRRIRFITVILSIFIFLDISLSFMAASRQTERRRNVEPHGSVDLFFDEYYPDEVMDRVYANKKEKF